MTGWGPVLSLTKELVLPNVPAAHFREGNLGDCTSVQQSGSLQELRVVKKPQGITLPWGLFLPKNKLLAATYLV